MKISRVIIMVLAMAAIANGSTVVWSDGFESGNFSGWNAGTAGTTPSVVTSGDGGALLPHSGNDMMVLGDAPFGYGLVQNNLSAPVSGATFTGYIARSSVLTQNPAQLVGFWVGASSGQSLFVQVDNTGAVLYRYGGDTQETGVTLAAGEWLKASVYAGPEGALISINDVAYPPAFSPYWDAAFDIKGAWAGSGWGNAGGQWYYDDCSVTVVPEPTTIALLGLGVVSLLRRKKV